MLTPDDFSHIELIATHVSLTTLTVAGLVRWVLHDLAHTRAEFKKQHRGSHVTRAAKAGE